MIKTTKGFCTFFFTLPIFKKLIGFDSHSSAVTTTEGMTKDLQTRNRKRKNFALYKEIQSKIVTYLATYCFSENAWQTKELLKGCFFFF